MSVRTSKAVEAEIARNRGDQAAASTAIARYAEASKTLAGNASQFFRARRKGETEGARLELLRDRETELLSELEAVRQHEEREAHGAQMDRDEAEALGAAEEFARVIPPALEGMAATFGRAEEAQRRARSANDKAKVLGMDRRIPAHVESIARPNKSGGVFRPIMSATVLPHWEHGQGYIWRRDS